MSGTSNLIRSLVTSLIWLLLACIAVLMHKITFLETTVADLQVQEESHRKGYLQLVKMHNEDPASAPLIANTEVKTGSADERRLDSIIKVNVVQDNAAQSGPAGCVTVDISASSEFALQLVDVTALCGPACTDVNACTDAEIADKWRCPNCMVFNGGGGGGFVCLKGCSSPKLSKTETFGDTGFPSSAVVPYVFINGNTVPDQTVKVFTNYDANLDANGDALGCNGDATDFATIPNRGSLLGYCLKNMPSGYGVEDVLYPVTGGSA